jgi:methyl-accepting chemotaxis protein
VLASVVLAAGCGGDDEASPTTAWANDVCSALGAFTSSVTESVDAVQEEGISREAVETAVADTRAAADELESTLGDVGAPPVEAGAEVEAAVEDVANAVDEGTAAVEQAVAGVSDVSSLLSAISTIATTLQETLDGVRESLSTLSDADPAGELRDAFDEASACDDLG